MDIMTHIVAAEEEELAFVGESNSPLDEWSGIEVPGLDSAKLAMLHCLLTEDTLQVALDAYQPVYISEGETIVLRIADEVLERLVAFDGDALESVATELAASEEFERELWNVEDVLGQLTELAELAQLADSQGQVLFACMRLLQD